VSFSSGIPKGTSSIYVEGSGTVTQPCLNRMARTLPVVVEAPGSATPGLPVVTVLPLEHTRDALSAFVPSAGRAPAKEAFKICGVAQDGPVNNGGPPLVGAERYAALRGEWPQGQDDQPGDQVVLVSCGPFHRLEPGQSISFSAALVAAPSLDSLQVALARA